MAIDITLPHVSVLALTHIRNQGNEGVSALTVTQQIRAIANRKESIGLQL
jgi:hypothetical protein